MSQAYATMATTTTAHVTVVCSGTSSLLMTVTMAPSLMGLSMRLDQHNVVFPPPLTLRDSIGVVGLATVQQQQPQSQMPLQAYAYYAMGHPQVWFSFRVEPPTDLLYVLVSVLVYAFCFQVSCWMLYLPMRAQPLGVCTIADLWSSSMAGICATC